MTKTRTCSVCFRDASWMTYGKFRNGREAEDIRCDEHRPDPTAIGTWGFLGLTAKMIRIEDVFRIAR